MDRWAGKVALVTGASAGIGAAVCVRLANDGLRVVGLARRPALIDELKSQVTGHGSIHSKQCDVSKPEDITVVFRWVEEQLGGVDVMVNNAGVLAHGNITDVQGKEISDEQLNSVIDTNVRGLMLCSRAAVRSMNARKVAGHVINVNSIAGHYVPMTNLMNVYSSTKYAVTAFTGALLNELASLGSSIRVTSVSPGVVDTPMADSVKVLKLPMLLASDVADAVAYALGTPPSVNINEITISPVGEKRL